ALAAKAATSTIPIVFGVADDAVALGLVASLARPGGNATGVNFLGNEAVPKQLGLLHELMPKVTRIAVLVNPSNRPASEIQLRAVQDAARQIGLRIDILKATNGSEIEEAFAVLGRERTEALFVNGDAYFISRRTQFATLAARYGIATAFGEREY